MQMYEPRILNSRLGDERRFRYIKYYNFHYYFYYQLEHFIGIIICLEKFAEFGNFPLSL